MQLTLTKVFQAVGDGVYIGFVAELPGTNTQGRSLEETRANLDETILLVLEAHRELLSKELEGYDNMIHETILFAGL